MLAVQQLKPDPPLHAHVMAGSRRALHLALETELDLGVEDAGGEKPLERLVRLEVAGVGALDRLQ
jgi:hypothetical protein